MSETKKRGMNREESIKTVKLMGMVGILSILSALLLDFVPIYGINTLIIALPLCWVLCTYLDEKPRQGMLITVVLVGALLTMPF